MYVSVTPEPCQSYLRSHVVCLKNQQWRESPRPSRCYPSCSGGAPCGPTWTPTCMWPEMWVDRSLFSATHACNVPGINHIHMYRNSQIDTYVLVLASIIIGIAPQQRRREGIDTTQHTNYQVSRPTCSAWTAVCYYEARTFCAQCISGTYNVLSILKPLVPGTRTWTPAINNIYLAWGIFLSFTRPY